MNDFPPCVGCGYCCLKCRCPLAVAKYGSSKDRCPALRWDDFLGRYVCRDYNVQLWEEMFGWGCTSSLNTWRQDVKDRG